MTGIPDGDGPVLSFILHAGQPHPLDVLHVRFDPALTDDELAEHAMARLQQLIPQAISKAREGRGSL